MHEELEDFLEELERSEKDQELYHSIYFIPKHYQEDDNAV